MRSRVLARNLTPEPVVLWKTPAVLSVFAKRRCSGKVSCILSRGDAARGDFAWRMGHDAAKQTLCQLAEDHGAVARAEVYGLFADVFDGVDATPEAWEQVPHRRRVAKIPGLSKKRPTEHHQRW